MTPPIPPAAEQLLARFAGKYTGIIITAFTLITFMPQILGAVQSIMGFAHRLVSKKARDAYREAHGEQNLQDQLSQISHQLTKLADTNPQGNDLASTLSQLLGGKGQPNASGGNKPTFSGYHHTLQPPVHPVQAMHQATGHASASITRPYPTSGGGGLRI
ncbi:MAG: hypothetical protein KC476_00935 [Cyanobacteria bacterium HKST-UBA06]|nr:hypothetical protein [Cyanobacteria bacterium HKST-UBA05]MCA9798494.1 hypothetical protein [Cyanobacteria bacterium HKST-UBA04]MCA9806494.1 hypothetical protein [Cyanobacteria bacterium HKST-UBA06]MCA9841744.1 hypothetical protein [Cyanobacteria bacterium HKST-UBA03]